MFSTVISTDYSDENDRKGVNKANTHKKWNTIDGIKTKISSQKIKFVAKNGKESKAEQSFSEIKIFQEWKMYS